eukprot:scaffold663109_cov60-Prasinocladus_malaysianus.AAC.1
MLCTTRTLYLGVFWYRTVRLFALRSATRTSYSPVRVRQRVSGAMVLPRTVRGRFPRIQTRTKV